MNPHVLVESTEQEIEQASTCGEDPCDAGMITETISDLVAHHRQIGLLLLVCRGCTQAGAISILGFSERKVKNSIWCWIHICTEARASTFGRLRSSREDAVQSTISCKRLAIFGTTAYNNYPISKALESVILIFRAGRRSSKVCTQSKRSRPLSPEAVLLPQQYQQALSSPMRL